MNSQRMYTQFLLPDGDKIILSFREEKELVIFQEKFPQYILLNRSGKSFNRIKDIIPSFLNTPSIRCARTTKSFQEV